MKSKGRMGLRMLYATLLLLVVGFVAMIRFSLIFMSKGGESSIADIAGFGTVRKKAARKRHISTGTSLDDVAGAGHKSGNQEIGSSSF